jgi:hypothetical protein
MICFFTDFVHKQPVLIMSGEEKKMEVKVIVSVYEDEDYQGAQEFFCTLRATMRNRKIIIPPGVKLSLVCETMADATSATWHRLISVESNTYRLRSTAFFTGLQAVVKSLCPEKRVSVSVPPHESRNGTIQAYGKLLWDA